MTTRLLIGDVRDRLAELPDGSVHCVVTSPPYFGLRDYGVPGQIGLEPTPEAYVATLVEVFRAVKRVLRDDGVLFLNLGDSYAAAGFNRNGESNSVLGSGPDGPCKQRDVKVKRTIPSGLKPKDLIGIPWRVAFALQADGWTLRSDIIWAKPNPMPESVTDRPTSAHEHVFLLAKSARYFYDADAIREQPTGRTDAPKGFGAAYKRTGKAPPTMDGLKGANARNVWTIATEPFAEAHFATFPPELAERCIKAGCPPGGTVLDPFAGAGTVGLVADRLQRNAVLIELNPAYGVLSTERIATDAPLFAAIATE